ncbi:MAG: hypothetical protein HY696_08405 [Deltaproteobacteria bacterium]|nr:hypothetical protein [Deltaproteobacteria bacterium]
MKRKGVGVGLGCVCGLLAALLPMGARAVSWRADADLVGQWRRNTSIQRELPANLYLGAGVADWGKWHARVQADGRVFRDLQRSVNEGDLYQGVLHLEPAKAWQFDLGRQFLNPGFSTELVDGARTTLLPWSRVDLSVYAGVPRTIERGDFNRDDGLLTGMVVRLHDWHRTAASLQAQWRKFDLQGADWQQNDTVRVGASASHQFGGKTAPLAYGLFEYDIAGKVIEAGTLGFDWSPTRRVALNLEGNYFNVNRAADRPSIMALFTSGPIWTGRIATTLDAVPDVVTLRTQYAYQRLTVGAGAHRTGHLLEVGIPIRVDRAHLELEPAYYFSKSYGGRVHGVRVLAHERIAKPLWAEVGLDYSSYQKITNESDLAFSTVFWTGYDLPHGWRVAVGGEYNKNNLFDRDLRGSLRVSYHYAK